jgi:hypothetical protein
MNSWAQNIVKIIFRLLGERLRILHKNNNLSKILYSILIFVF